MAVVRCGLLLVDVHVDVYMCLLRCSRDLHICLLAFVSDGWLAKQSKAFFVDYH